MSHVRLRDRTPRSARAGALDPPLRRSRLLVVSEDPAFVEQVRSAVAVGVQVVACLGPTASDCVLEDQASCPLAERSSVVLVDQPPGGVFRYHWKHLSAPDYADLLQRVHPSAVVLLTSGESPSDEHREGVPYMARVTALRLLTWLLPNLVLDPERSMSTTGGEE